MAPHLDVAGGCRQTCGFPDLQRRPERIPWQASSPRHEPLAVIPIALLFGGIGASNGLLQRVDHLPDATVGVLQGILFVVILASETLYGRFAFFRPRDESAADRAAVDVVETSAPGVPG